MVKSQKKKAEVVAYMEENAPHLLGNEYRATRIRECCNVLRFLNYGGGKQKLYKSNFCKYDKLCLACATRRSIKKIQLFEAMIQKHCKEKGIVKHDIPSESGLQSTVLINEGNKFRIVFFVEKYNHTFPDGREQEANMYPIEVLPYFRRFVNEVRIPENAMKYFKDKDPLALNYLPKILIYKS